MRRFLFYWLVWATSMIVGLATHVYGFVDGWIVMIGDALVAVLICTALIAISEWRLRRSRR